VLFRSALTILIVASGLSLFGCAEVRSPAPNAPRAPLSPKSGVNAGAAGTADGEAQPASFDEAQGPDAEPETPEPDGEEDVEGESADFTACLDRGPSKPPHCPQFTWKSPLEGMSQSEIEKKVKTDLASIGPISLGFPHAGRLFNGVQMPENEHWTFTDHGDAWGTQETIESITRAIDKVFTKYPDSPKVVIGHISAKGGGRMRPHVSHQAGRDVDLSYFYSEKVGWYTYATEQNLDRGRTWAFVKAFVEDPNTEMILMDSAVQRLVYDFAKEHGENADMLDRIFQVSGKSTSPIIRHAHGHATHIHVRFFSPSAQASGRLAGAYLPKPPPPTKRSKGKHPKNWREDVATASEGGNARKAKSGDGAKAKEEDAYYFHRARSGDTLDSLARRYGVSIEAIKQANGLRSNHLKEKQTYRIPKPDHSVASSASPGKSRRRH